MNVDGKPPSLFYRVLGGICGACAGAGLGIGAAALVDSISNHTLVLGWGTSIAIGAIAGLLVGVVFPAVGETLAHIVTMFMP